MSDGVKANLSEVLGVVKSLRALGADDFQEAFKPINAEVSRIVVDRAQMRAAATGRRNVVKAAETVLAAPAAKAAGVTMGSESGMTWAMAAMFGTYPDRQRTSPKGKTYTGWSQFLMARKGGYVVYPAIDDESDRIAEVYASAVDKYLSKKL